MDSSNYRGEYVSINFGMHPVQVLIALCQNAYTASNAHFCAFPAAHRHHKIVTIIWGFLESFGKFVNRNEGQDARDGSTTR